MVELPDDERLAAILASVGDHLIVDDTLDTAGVPAIARPHANGWWPRWRRLAVAAAVVAIVVASALAAPPVRRAVARLLGIGSTDVRFGSATDGEPEGLPTLVAGARPLEHAEAESLLGQSLPDTSGTSLGRPQRLAGPPEGGVIMLWSQGTTTLWIHHSDTPAQVYLKKLVSAGNSVVSVDNLGDGALLVTGQHVLVTPSRRLAARTVLLWTSGTTEYRLESDLKPRDLEAIGRAIEP